MPFSSTKFLKIIENQRIKRVKLYQFLLILVRTLFIIFLVLTFARPTISSLTGDVSGNAQTTAVIIFDDSYSMQAFASSRTYNEIASEHLQKLISVFKSRDKVFLLSTAFNKPVLIDGENKKNILKRANASNNLLNLEKLLNTADSLFNENLNLNNELYFISDLKITDKEAFKDYDFSSISNFKAYKIDLAEEASFNNVSIDSIELNNQLIEAGKTVNISVFISNHDEDGSMETNLNLYKEDVRTAMNSLSLMPGESKKVDIQYVPQLTGTHYMNLQIDEDDLSADNNFYFSLFIKEKIRALFVSDQPSSETSLALKILAQNSLFEIDQKKYNEWLGANLNNYDLVLLNNPENNDDPTINKLKTFMESGLSVIVIPGESFTQNTYNDFFHQVGSTVRFNKFNNAGQNSFFSLEKEKTSNSIFDAIFRDKESNFSPPKLFKYFEQSGFDEPLVTLSNEDVFLSRSDRLYIFSSAFSSSWSNFEINGLFLPLIYRTLYLAAHTKKPLSGSVVSGENIIFSSDGRDIENNFSIKAPGKEAFSVIPRSLQNKLYFNGGIADNPGVYFLFENNTTISSVSVNHSALELKKPFITENSFSFDLVPLNQDEVSQQILGARTGSELWLFFLVLAFCMLMAEMILIKKIEGLPLFGIR